MVKCSFLKRSKKIVKKHKTKTTTENTLLKLKGTRLLCLLSDWSTDGGTLAKDPRCDEVQSELLPGSK